MNTLFGKQPILLPNDVDLSKWAVIACDQYTTNMKYWDDLSKEIGEAPSTLKLIFPEIFLKEKEIDERIDRINKTMKQYTDEGLFKEIPGMVLVERTLSTGKKRIGLVLSVDLETYEYRKKEVPIRATEATIIERLPVRMKIKKNATIELPHILLLIDDKKKEIIEPLFARRNDFEKLYDFSLIKNGGHVCGYHIPSSKETEDKLIHLLDADVQKDKYGYDAGILFAVGDGNHSMASAKEHWNIIKRSLSEEERKTHPARFILVEVVNLYQDSMDFEPIHRVIMNCDRTSFIEKLKTVLDGNGSITVVSSQGKTALPCPEDPADTIKRIQDFLLSYRDTHNVIIDYEHSEEQVLALASQKNTVGILMPTFDKSKLFHYIVHNGNLPQKAFSIGTEDDKKYYIEAKRIVL